MLTGYEQEMLTIGRPLRVEVEGKPGHDFSCIRTVGVGDVHLVALVVRDPPAVGRRIETVGKLSRAFRQVSLVLAIPVHRERVRIAVDECLKAEPRRVLRPEEEAAVVKADAIHGRNVCREIVRRDRQESCRTASPRRDSGTACAPPPIRAFSGPSQPRPTTASRPSGDQPANCVQASGSRVSSSARRRRPVPSARTTTARIVATLA